MSPASSRKRALRTARTERARRSANRAGPRTAGAAAGSFLVLAAGVFLAAQGLGPAPPRAACQAAGHRPLDVRARFVGTTHYVGESLELEVRTSGAATLPVVVAPRVADADVRPAGTGERPPHAGVTGKLAAGDGPYVTRFRVVPRRPGLLRIPPIAVRSGELTGASKPLQLNVQPVPQSGRTAAFLGGVGSFEVSADARPATVRVGEVLEYRLRVDGPAARGMTGAPDVARRNRGANAPRFETLPVEAIDDPPSRVFRYRIRPLRAGPLVLAPVAIAAFEPRTKQYLTRMSPSVRVRVVAIARFDPATLAYGVAPDQSPHWRYAVVAAGIALTLLAAGVSTRAVLRARLARGRSERAVRRLLAGLIQGLDATSGGAAETGRWITEGLAEYLHVKLGRPRGALTPAEARAGIARAERDNSLAARAERLVARCDHAQFAADRASLEELAGEARAFFGALRERAERERKTRRAFEKPREAVKTATP